VKADLTVTLHLGTPKSGTTALQNLLATNRPVLGKNGESCRGMVEPWFRIRGATDSPRSTSSTGSTGRPPSC
jgi:hypothetical protein